MNNILSEKFQKDKMLKSAYIHIPFCKKKCKYCTFVSCENLILKEEYLKALDKEIRVFYKGETLDTVYFGGGTPSLLDIADFKNILNIFNINPSHLTPLPKGVRENSREITVEINPETVDKKYLTDLMKTGVNRLSIGVQDFNDDILKNIGRIHTSKKAEEIIKTAQAVGFKNISIDLIYGLPNQTKKMFLESLEKAISLDIQHISFYGLKIEKGCEFYKNMPSNLPNDDMQADYYLEAIKVCKENGFEHYEVSNFGKPGFYSRHNLNYWNNEHYYGFGASASGYEKNVRYYNQKNIKTYIKNPLKKEREDVLTPKQQLEEEIFLGFRKCEGINVDKINKKFGIDFEKKYQNVIKKYSEKYLIKTDVGYKLSDEGILLSNIILSEFL